MGAAEIEAFISHFTNDSNVAAATHQQAVSALLFLYKEVLGVDLSRLDEIGRPKKPQRLPTVLTAGEVQRLLAHLDGMPALRRSQSMRCTSASSPRSRSFFRRTSRVGRIRDGEVAPRAPRERVGARLCECLHDIVDDVIAR